MLRAARLGEDLTKFSTTTTTTATTASSSEMSDKRRFKCFQLAKLMEAPLDEDLFEEWLNHVEMDINGADFYGNSPLHKLLAFNKPQSVKRLVRHRRFDRSLFYKKCGAGNTALLVGLQMSALNAVRALLLECTDAEREQMFNESTVDGVSPHQVAESMQYADADWLPGAAQE